MQPEFTTKICSHCGIDKPLDEFYNEKKKPDGKCNYCKDCMKAIRNFHHEKNKTYENKRALQYYRNNKDKIYEKQQLYNKSENGKIVAKRARKKRYQKVKNEYPGLFKSNMIQAIISNRFSANTRWNYNFSRKIKGLNYTYQQLRDRLESQFINGMDWNNYGKLWEIDHIKPKCSFNLDNKEQFDECWDINNLRPLLRTDNQSKIKQDISNKNLVYC